MALCSSSAAMSRVCTEGLSSYSPLKAHARSSASDLYVVFHFLGVSSSRFLHRNLWAVTLSSATAPRSILHVRA